MPRPVSIDKHAPCETCGKAMARKRFAGGQIEDRGVFLRRRFCSGYACAAAARRVPVDVKRQRRSARAKARRLGNVEHYLAKERAKRKANPEAAKRWSREATLRKYGITTEDYEAMLAGQGGVCLICGRAPKARSLNVDHDHKTGKVRGLLCHQCNRHLLGALERYPRRVPRALAYLAGETLLPPKEPL